MSCMYVNTYWKSSYFCQPRREKPLMLRMPYSMARRMTSSKCTYLVSSQTYFVHAIDKSHFWHDYPGNANRNPGPPILVATELNPDRQTDSKIQKGNDAW